MTTATVEGVEVDTRHWIGGERVASESTLTDISPIDERPLAEVAAGSAGTRLRCHGLAALGWPCAIGRMT